MVCNREAQGFRLKRKLYYSPMPWRVGAPLAPFLVLLAGVWLEVPYLTLGFWPLIVALLIANWFVRKSLKIDFAVCKRHRDLRATLLTLSWVCVLGVVMGVFSLAEGRFALFVLLGSLAGLLVLGALQTYVGVQAIRLKDLSAEHVWLSGTGERFRGTLPELN